MGLHRKIDAIDRLLPVVLNHVLVLAFGIVGIKLISQWVPPATYATFSLFLTLTTFGQLFFYAGLINFVSRYWQWEREHAGALVHFVWSRFWQLSVPLTVTLTTLSLLLGWSLGADWHWTFPCLLMANLSISITALIAVVFNAQEQNWMVLAIHAASALRWLAPVGLVIWVGASFLVLTGGLAIHSSLMLGMAYLWFRRAGKPKRSDNDLHVRWMNQLRDYGRPFLLLGIGGWLLQSVDRWLVILIYGNEHGGLFSMAAGIGSMAPSLIAGVLMQLVFPGVFRLSDQAAGVADWRQIFKRCDHLTMFFLTATLGGLALLTVVVPMLVPWLISPAYASTARMIFPAGCAMAIPHVNQFLFLLLQGQQNSRDIVRILLSVAMLKTMGGWVAALISWQAYLVWCCVSLFLAYGLGRYLVLRMGIKQGGPRRDFDAQRNGNQWIA